MGLMEEKLHQVVSLYEKTKSIKETARHTHIAESTVKKILISEGVYETARSREIAELYNAGKNVHEIAKELNLTETCISSYLPYTRGSYLTPSETVNAKKIRKFRKKAVD